MDDGEREMDKKNSRNMMRTITIMELGIVYVYTNPSVGVKHGSRGPDKT